MAEQGRLIVLSGPSGSGKSTVVRSLMTEGEFPLRFSVSATTRAPRPGEVHGQHYLFLSQDEFCRQRDSGALLEWAEVHGMYYGTPAEPIDQATRAGVWMVMDIDPQGMRQVRQLRPEAVTIFLRAPSLEVYEQRLRARGTDDPAAIVRRLRDAEQWLKQTADYDYQVLNEHLPQTIRTFRALLRGLR